MISTIISDFSRVILDVKNKEYKGSLNSLYKDLLSHNRKFDFFDYFELNNDILNLLTTLRNKYSINVFTTGTIQRAPEISEIIKPIFDNVLVAEELGLDKKVSDSYIKIAEILDKSTDDIFYIDDQAENIKAAKTAGLVTFLYADFKERSYRIAVELHR